ncbi:MAG: peptide ABC transporter permease, partial [Gammaproteobacteria bacterium]
MPFLPVFLWTDILIYILLAVITASILYIRQRPHLRAPWRQVFQRKRGIISIMILFCYVAIGLLDSVHFRPALESSKSTGNAQQHYSSEVITLLDLVVMPLRQQLEKTYSAPFATRSFVREMQTSTTSTVAYDYSKLKFAGSHLSNEQQKWTDISYTILQSTLWAVVSCLVIIILAMTYIKRKTKLGWQQQFKSIVSAETVYPLRTLIFMLLALLVTVFNLTALSLDYHIFGTDKVG